jgi:hypothetical protein
MACATHTSRGTQRARMPPQSPCLRGWTPPPGNATANLPPQIITGPGVGQV